MQFTLATIALVASAHFVAAQGVTALLAPKAPAPAGCKTDYAGTFEITVVKPAAKRDVQKRATCAATGTAVLKLSGSVLTDALGRIGSIVANHQFQFDGPPAQAGAIYTGGFSVCGNGSLALGGSNIFYQCKSGDFYNLYDNPDNGALCQPILIDIMPCGSVGQGADGQPTAGSATAAATQIPDGQIQASSAHTAPAATQIPDGQIQVSSAHTAPAAAVTQIGDGQVQAPSAAPAPVTQISDGQIQVQPSPPAAPVVQISDGQVQATTAAAATGAPVSQIGDGQIQATPAAATGAPVSQIGDGQIQATPTAAATTLHTTAAAPVSQIPDGQVQAGSATTPAAAPTTTAVFTGAAAAQTGSWVAAVVFAGAAALL